MNATTDSFSAKDFFAQWQIILTKLFYSTFGVVKTRKSADERMEQFVLDVEAAATSLCVVNNIPTAEREEAEQQLRSSSSMLVPILLTLFFSGREPSLDSVDEKFAKRAINLVGSGSDGDRKLVGFTNSRLDNGDCFLRAGGCQGEAYLLPGAGVFKPEFMAKPTTRLRQGFKGVECLREIAAFRVDQAYGGFARVPPTAPVTLSVDALPDQEDDSIDLVSGSLQKWVHNVGSFQDMGYTPRVDMNDVHHIGILDILLYNTDRHGGNMLIAKSSGCSMSCGKSKTRLVPIDHGLCLPDYRHLYQAEFDWLHSKQAQQPFGKHDLGLIASFEGDEVAGILRELNLSSGTVLTARIMVSVLQETAVKRGWNLREIGKFCIEKTFDAKSSELADVVAKTAIAAGFGEGEISFEEHEAFINLFKKILASHLEARSSVAIPV